MKIDLDELEIRAARAEDLSEILRLLEECSLITDGVDDHVGTYVVARDHGELVSCGGSEAYQFAALIRSIAVRSDYRRQGLGRRMVREVIDRLASRGLREFYLLTIDAEPYFRRRGFKTIDRDQVHPQLLGSAELQGACPDDAVCMRLVMPG